MMMVTINYPLISLQIQNCNCGNVFWLNWNYFQGKSWLKSFFELFYEDFKIVWMHFKFAIIYLGLCTWCLKTWFEKESYFIYTLVSIYYCKWLKKYQKLSWKHNFEIYIMKLLFIWTPRTLDFQKTFLVRFTLKLDVNIKRDTKC